MSAADVEQRASWVLGTLNHGIGTLLPHAAPFPWHVGNAGDEITCGSIFDASGHQIAVIDPNRSHFGDAAAHNIAHAICLAVNTITGHDTSLQPSVSLVTTPIGPEGGTI